MTGGSRSRFLIAFALYQLKSNRKSGLHRKLPTKPGRRWAITFIGQKTDSYSTENDVKKGISEDSEFEGNIEEVDDYLNSYESSPTDDYEGTQLLQATL